MEASDVLDALDSRERSTLRDMGRRAFVWLAEFVTPNNFTVRYGLVSWGEPQLIRRRVGRAGRLTPLAFQVLALMPYRAEPSMPPILSRPIDARNQAIKTAYAGGVRQARLARDYGLSRQRIHNIVHSE